MTRHQAAERRQLLRWLLARAATLPLIRYATDNVFADGASLQMATVTGNATQGYVVTLAIAVNG
ncbi:hypothetical protein CNX70_17655 [Janthinobacterium svalbardensis]|uniref:Uncharacterized protein n=1 Tax=Janthinobacterium svalbardensis TaxID=368607 RepID=A0A290WY52_9BURK|nr:hypothetical protein [Janthinobacterium svalbardensis]ATD61783.1 hypothetical protein CNX70_17655 [Janthinobacterium svalbardensis]